MMPPQAGWYRRSELLPSANGRLIVVELTGNDFLGPPLAGRLVAAGAAFAFGAPAAPWLVAVAVLLLVSGPFRIERTPGTTMRTEIAEGLRFLWRHRLLRRFAAMTGSFNFASNAVFAILVLYAVGPASAIGLSEPAYPTDRTHDTTTPCAPSTAGGRPSSRRDHGRVGKCGGHHVSLPSWPCW